MEDQTKLILMIPEDMREALDVAAEKHGQSRAEVVRWAIRYFLPRSLKDVEGASLALMDQHVYYTLTKMPT